MSTILVTGGGGFIGYPLLEAIAARGDTAVGFDLSFPVEAVASSRMQMVIGDITDAPGVIAAVKAHAVDSIIHTAAIFGIAPSVQMAGTVIRVNIDGSINVFEAARILGVRRVVNMSSEEVY